MGRADKGIGYPGNSEGLSLYVLGTVQLGFDYGIANREGMPNQETADGIVRVACEEDNRVFDTVQAYRRSESLLGEALKMNDFRRKHVLLRNFCLKKVLRFLC